MTDPNASASSTSTASTRQPIRLGVTGGIASGKSTVMARLHDLGAETIDADQVYHGLIAPGEPLNRALIAEWGDGIANPDGSINRPALGRIVFSDPEQLRRLDAITHPAIRTATEAMVAASRAEVVAVDAVKLIESGHADRCDQVWLVVASPETQLRRLIDSRGMTEADARQRVAAQPPLQPRIERADVILNNDGDRDALRRQVDREWTRLPGIRRG